MQILEHIQTVPSNQWILHHNFNNRYVSVDVFIDYFGSITQVLPNNVTQPTGLEFVRVVVDFTSPQTGRAIIIAN